MFVVQASLLMMRLPVSVLLGPGQSQLLTRKLAVPTGLAVVVVGVTVQFTPLSVAV